MKDDYLLLIFEFLVYGVTLFIFSLRSKNKLKTVTTNLIILGLYGGLFTYNIVYNGKYGSGFLWFFYLTCSIALHWFVNLIGLILTFTKTNQQR